MTVYILEVVAHNNWPSAIRSVDIVLRSRDSELIRLNFGYEDGNGMSHDEELRWTRLREGTHRASSRETPGYDRDLLRENGTNNLLGPTESRPANIDEIIRSHTPASPSHPTLAQQVVGQVVSDFMNALTPHIMHGVDVAVDTKLGIPKAVEWAKRRAEQRKSKVRSPNPPFGAQLYAVPAKETSDLDDESDTLESQKPSVTAEQYQAALRSAIEAEEYAAQMRQALAHVKVRDGAESPTQTTLEEPVSSIDETRLIRAIDRLDSSSWVDDQFILVRSQDANALLRAVDQLPS